MSGLLNKLIAYTLLYLLFSGEKAGDLVRGLIRINQKNPRDSFVSHADSTQADYYIGSVVDRNRALDGDEVLLKLKSDSEVCEGRMSAVVVYISRKVRIFNF